MKRIVLTVMAVLLCFILLGCGKEPVKTDVPKVDETVTPSEIETPETPVEPEQPTEPDITEPADDPTQTEGKLNIPSVFNVPEWSYSFELDESKKATIIPSTSEGDTIVYDIGFPEYYPLESYSPINTISTDEFEWGEYSPIVHYAVQDYSTNKFDPLSVNFSVITPEIEEIEEGASLYNNLIKDYGAEQNFIEPSWRYRSEDDLDESIKHTLDSVIKTDKFRILQDGMGSGKLKQNIYIYSSLASHPAYVIKYDFRNELFFSQQLSLCCVTATYLNIIEFINNRYLFFEIYNHDDFLVEDIPKPTYHIYRFDVITGELKFIESYVDSFVCSISPDGKYLIYTPPLTDIGDKTHGNNVKNMSFGFYIKNLETEDTVFYNYDYKKNGFKSFPHPYHNATYYALGIVGWVKQELV